MTDIDPKQMRRIQEISAQGGLVGALFSKVSDTLNAKQEMTPAQALDHRYAAEAGRRADALRSFRSCLHLASEAEGNGDDEVAEDHRADAIKALERYPEMLVAIETAVGERIPTPVTEDNGIACDSSSGTCCFTEWCETHDSCWASDPDRDVGEK